MPGRSDTLTGTTLRSLRISAITVNGRHCMETTTKNSRNNSNQPIVLQVMTHEMRNELTPQERVTLD